MTIFGAILLLPMLSVGKICFEDSIALAAKRVGKGKTGGHIHAIWLYLLAVERMALVGTGWIISYLVSTNGHSNPSPFVGHHFWYCRQILVKRSVCW